MPLIKVLNRKGKYHDADAREVVINYILNPAKAISGFMGCTSNVNPLDIAGSMESFAQLHKKTKGIQLRHTVISFTPDEVDDPEIVNEIAREVASFVGQNYQTVFSVHEDREHLHFHLVCNSVGYNGKKYLGKKKDYYDFIKVVKNILHCYAIYRVITVSSLSDADIQGNEKNHVDDEYDFFE